MPIDFPPTDSLNWKTPWSVFQDGMKIGKWLQEQMFLVDWWWNETSHQGKISFPPMLIPHHFSEPLYTFFFLMEVNQFPAPSNAREKNSPPSSTLYPIYSPSSWLKNTSKPVSSTFSNHSVPSMQFQVLFTFLSKFFSTFLRSTYSLSVFASYLDLAELYQLIYAVVPNYVTLNEMLICELERSFTGLSPFLALCSNKLKLLLIQPVHSIKRSIREEIELFLPSFPLIFAMFVRHYWSHHFCFLFLGLIICLNSPRNEDGVGQRKRVCFSNGALRCTFWARGWWGSNTCEFQWKLEPMKVKAL